jgi:hypothetical protein
LQFSLQEASPGIFGYTVVYNILVGKPKGRDHSHGSPLRRWEDNIRMDLREIGWEGVDWILLAQDRDKWQAVVNTAMNLRFP